MEHLPGCSTWTDNPLIALYFALADHSGNSDAAVWALNPWWLNRQLGKDIEGVILPDWQEANPYLQDLEDAFDEGPVGARWNDGIAAECRRQLIHLTWTDVLLPRAADLLSLERPTT